jgi:hypothetical protein
MQNLARYVAERYTWQEFGANVHPGAFGASLYGNNIITMFNEAWQDSLLPDYRKFSYPMPAVPIDSFSYYNGRFISIDSAYDVSGWQKIDSWSPSQGGSRPDFNNRPVLSGNAGSTLKFDFSGKLIGVEGITSQYMGRIMYDIDNGMHTGVIDTRSDLTLHIGRALLFAQELADGDHVLGLEVDDQTSGTTTETVIFNFIVN